jgi:N-acetylglucosaminyl-diphospho-decaprenol L-rhamnosyltransferase
LGAPVVSITVVAYNSDHTLRACLDSVRADVASGLAELIVVDNASPDESAQIVAREHPEALLVRAAWNGGFASGSNLGWSKARGRYWLLLNPDVEVPAGGLASLLAWMDAHPRMGVASPELVDAEGVAGGSARRFPSIRRTLLEMSRLHRLLPGRVRARLFLGGYRPVGEDGLDADWVPATAMLVRRDAVEAAGTLAEDLPLYGEDTEWCARIGQAGFGVGVCASLRVPHRASASARRTLGDDERDRREAYGVHEADARMRGRWHARALLFVNTLALALESIVPGRPEPQRARIRRYLAAHRRLIGGWRPGALPGAAAPAAREGSWS